MSSSSKSSSAAAKRGSKRSRAPSPEHVSQEALDKLTEAEAPVVAVPVKKGAAAPKKSKKKKEEEEDETETPPASQAQVEEEEDDDDDINEEADIAEEEEGAEEDGEKDYKEGGEDDHPAASSSSSSSSPATALVTSSSSSSTVAPLGKISPAEASLRSLFSRKKGYSFWYDIMSAKRVTVAVSKVSEKKKAAMVKKAGREIKNMKDRYVNVNALFPVVSVHETILSKFLPDFGTKANMPPHHVTQLSPPCRLQWVRLTGLGSFDKPTHAADSRQKAQHEFHLNFGAYDEERVTEDGMDLSAAAWKAATMKLWAHLAMHIVTHKEIAPDLHAMTEAAVKAAAKKDKKLVYEKAYKEHHLAQYIKDYETATDFKFATKMFRYPSVDEVKAYKETTPYKAPSDVMQQMYDTAMAGEQVVYQDLPVIRLKTPAELKAGPPKDKNPFIYVPYAERGKIVSGELASCLYDVGITESAQNKSHLKLKPLLLIWFPSETAGAGVEQGGEEEEEPVAISTAKITIQHSAPVAEEEE
jgi:hypothetical protein